MYPTGITGRDKPAGVARHQDLNTDVKVRSNHSIRYTVDISNIERELGWKPSDTFESGINTTLEWYLSQVCGETNSI